MIDLITLHPKLVHFPIALLSTGVVFQFLHLWKKDDFFFKTAKWTHALGLLGAIMAASSGLIAADTLGHDAPNHDLVHTHRNWMLITLIPWCLFVLNIWKGPFKNNHRLNFGISLLVAGSLTWGSYLGGDLVFKYGVGVKAKSATELQHEAVQKAEQQADREAGGKLENKPEHKDDGHHH